MRMGHPDRQGMRDGIDLYYSMIGRNTYDVWKPR